MSRIGIYVTTMALIMLLVLGTFNSAMAGEKLKIKASATSINTKWNQIEVGDVEGQVIGLYENTQVWVDDITGERMTGYNRGTMDFNTKTGQGTMFGYSVLTWPNGDKRYAISEGKMVGKGKWEGTFTDIDGTGKFKGTKGGGTWKSESLGREISHIVAEGERTLQ